MCIKIITSFFLVMMALVSCSPKSEAKNIKDNRHGIFETFGHPKSKSVQGQKSIDVIYVSQLGAKQREYFDSFFKKNDILLDGCFRKRAVENQKQYRNPVDIVLSNTNNSLEIANEGTEQMEQKFSTCLNLVFKEAIFELHKSSEKTVVTITLNPSGVQIIH